MKTAVVAFFNNKGGVGKTSLVYHLAWMYADLGVRVIAADLDPQANLTSAFLDEKSLEELWTDKVHSKTIYGSILPVIKGTGDISPPYVENVADNLGLIIGDLNLSSFEDELSSQWTDCMAGKERAFRVISSFGRILRHAAKAQEAELILVDVGPNLGAINRAALISADFVVVPLSPDLFSIQGLQNLGPTLMKWRREWKERIKKNPDPSLEIPKGGMQPIGYIVLQHAVRLDRPVKAYERWIRKIPKVYREEVLKDKPGTIQTPQEDPDCLALIKHYRSLMPLAQEANKPIFHLKPADGAIGAHVQAVQEASKDFQRLAFEIGKKVGFKLESKQRVERPLAGEV
ncbi:MAG: AAA family ATPase [Elusimicrobia bacterium]|nr:AAA family ATPase [Elusimicrobiota bacterium]